MPVGRTPGWYNGRMTRAILTTGTELRGDFYTKVIGWVTASFVAAGLGAVLVGPLVPPAASLGLSIAVLLLLVVTAFVRVSPVMSNALAIAVPAVLGVVLYPVLNTYVATGAGNLVTAAATGAALIFGGMALWGWTSKRSLNKWSSKLFFILLGVIALSLLNVFLFKLTVLELVISAVTVVIFAIWSFIDIQAVRDKSRGDMPASYYALSIFLDILNLFTALLRLMSAFR